MEVDNRRVARNAVALTMRMIVVLVIGLFTSRKVLEALGVDDFGIYGVVGSLVLMGSFLNMSMSGATTRFITYSMGRGQTARLQTVFSTALVIHMLLAAAVLLVAETVGLWFLNYKMVIPPDRMAAANVIYQLSLCNMVLYFTQAPYMADILARERMGIYAYLEIASAVLKLAIVYLVLGYGGDRLVLYGILMFAVQLLITLLYRLYCIRHFEEARFSLRLDKPLARQMLSFSGYDLYTTAGILSKDQGVPVILNLFYGVVANTAAALAYSVMCAIRNLTTAISHAFQPQITKQYAAGDVDAMTAVMRRSAQFSLAAFTMVAIPFILEPERILGLWLGNVPAYAASFVRLVTIASFFDIVVNVTYRGIQATGKVKLNALTAGSMYLLCPILSYVSLRLEAPAQAVYYVNICVLAAIMLVSWYIIARLIPEMHVSRFIGPVLRSLTVAAVALSLSLAIHSSWPWLAQAPMTGDSWQALATVAVTTLIGVVLVCTLSYLIAFNAAERAFITAKIKKLRRRRTTDPVR